MKTKKIFSLFLIVSFIPLLSNYGQVTDKGIISTFTNSVLYADVPDHCLIRVYSFYYLISTTMHLMPGVPVMKSKDLARKLFMGTKFAIFNYATKLLGGYVDLAFFEYERTM